MIGIDLECDLDNMTAAVLLASLALGQSVYNNAVDTVAKAYLGNPDFPFCLNNVNGKWLVAQVSASHDLPDCIEDMEDFRNAYELLSGGHKLPEDAWEQARFDVNCRYAELHTQASLVSPTWVAAPPSYGIKVSKPR